jgi:hypothetical protein
MGFTKDQLHAHRGSGSGNIIGISILRQQHHRRPSVLPRVTSQSEKIAATSQKRFLILM